MLWISGRQPKLRELINQAVEWGAAGQKARMERETEWALVERLSRDGSCRCGDSGCIWWAMAEEFFKNNTAIDRERLAAAVRKIITFGPSKDVPVPLITGNKNCGKSTVADPVINVFGEEHILGKPKLGAPIGAYGDIAKGTVRFVYWDDYRPVEYAAMPPGNPTVPVLDFLAFFQGQRFKPQVSQSFNDGHPSVTWKKGALITAKREGLWEPMGNVTAEEIDHMKARVELFHATHVVSTNPDEFQPSPACPNPWCRWLVTDSMAYAARQGPRHLGTLGAKLLPKPLPALPDQGAPSANPLAADVRARIDANREAAKKRKLEKELQEHDLSALAAPADDITEQFPDYDAFDVLCGPADIDNEA